MTPERADFFAAVQSQSEAWKPGRTNSHDRAVFFSTYLAHEDRLLRNTALLEFHRAPYSLARQFRDAVPTHQLLMDLRNVQRLAYAPAVIRLLGTQSDPEAQAFVRNGYKSALSKGGSNLADWALAGIEVDGPAAIRLIGSILAQSDRSQEDKLLLVQALAAGGTARPKFQTQILEIYNSELTKGASLAGGIALAAHNWDTNALDEAFRTLLSGQEVEPGTMFLIQYALGDARN